MPKSKLTRSLTDLPEILLLLKQAMKRSKLSYAQLAASIGMSESGLKKIWTARDCSFGRLEQIAGALELQLSDLLLELQHSKSQEISMDSQTEKFFISHFEYFEFYWKLFFERMTVEEINSDLQLSDRQSFRYLRKLDQLGMIELHPGGRVKLKTAPFAYFRKGPLLEMMKEKWAKPSIIEAFSAKGKPSTRLGFYYFRLSQDSYQRLGAELNQLISAFTQETVRNLNLRKADTDHYRLVFSTLPGSFVARLK